MKRISVQVLILACVLLFFYAGTIFSAGWFTHLFGSGEGTQQSKSWGFKKRGKLVQNQLYRDECGACHWPFPPKLWYQDSWKKLMDGLENHFGEDATLAPEDEKKIRVYLIQNSTSLSRFEKTVPTRITDRFIKRHGHRGMTARLRRHPEVKTFSNCPACHKRAEYGVFGHPHH